MIPMYVISGFLESGKTHLLNQCLYHPIHKEQTIMDKNILVIQLENGIEPVELRNTEQHLLKYTLRQYHEFPEQIIFDITEFIINGRVEEVWVELNGMIEIDSFLSFIETNFDHDFFVLKRTIHSIDGSTFYHLYGQTGDSFIEQLTKADAIYVRNADELLYRQIRKQVRAINPMVECFNEKQTDELIHRIYRRRVSNIMIFVTLSFGLFLTYIISLYGFGLSQTSFNTLMTIYLGMLFQAIPFLALGVLISSLIIVFVPATWFERKFPTSKWKGYLFAIGSGFMLPVCDCASIPIFNSLIRKGVPVGPAVTFLCATPVINPLVMISTYFAFGNSIGTMLVRVGLGIVASLLIGLFFSQTKRESVIAHMTSTTIICNCGILDGTLNVGQEHRLLRKLQMVLSNSQNEFFNIAKYLIIGCFLSSLIQMYFPKTLLSASSAGQVVNVIILMVFAFVISLCSSSDAVVARGLMTKFPLSAAMGFMVFGPMMDIKNVILLSGVFKKKFILKLTFISFSVSLLVVLLFYRIFWR